MNLPTEFGALTEHARTAVRLHPAQGEPAVGESHLGGPLLWPASEPWPTCPVTWPPKPEATDDGWTGGHPDDEPVPAMVGAAQLYRRDFPELLFPDGTDLAQVLLCPTLHTSKHHYGPAVRLVWRDSKTVGEVAEAPEPPADADDMFLPRPRVLDPCRLEEFPYVEEFPRGRRGAGIAGEPR